MESNRHLQSLNAEVELVTDEGFRGNKLVAFYCQNEKCGYVELYRVKQTW